MSESEKDCFVMFRGAYVKNFSKKSLNMVLAKMLALAMEEADAKELATTIPGATVVKIDGSDVMSLPNILEMFRAFDASNDAVRLFEEKVLRIPRQVENEQEKTMEVNRTVNRLFHRASFDPGVTEFWDKYSYNPFTFKLLFNIAVSEAMILVSGVDH